MVRILNVADLSGQRTWSPTVRFDGTSESDLTRHHTVRQIVEGFHDFIGISDELRGRLEFGVFSRGRRLDFKTPIGDLPAEDVDLIVMPDVSAG